MMFDILGNPCAAWSILEDAVENCTLGDQQLCNYKEWIIEQGEGEWIYSTGICNDVPNVSKTFHHLCIMGRGQV